MFSFHKRYFILTLLLFVTELFIGFYMHDQLIRPYGGDYLVVMLIYCFIKSFITIPVWKAALATLLFAYLVEFLQYLDVVQLLGLQHSRTATILIGTSFSWVDILSYTLGVLTVVLVEFFMRLKKSKIRS